jgi:hypothetical protein
MAGTLTFPIDDTLKTIVAHARASAVRKPTFGELLDPSLLRDGVVPKGPYPEADDLDQKKIPHSLWLVADQGVYLMSPGTDPLPAAKGTGNLVAYAKECDPSKPGFYDAKRRIMGGDDCVEAIDLAAFESAIAENAHSIEFLVNEDELRLVVVS